MKALFLLKFFPAYIKFSLKHTQVVFQDCRKKSSKPQKITSNLTPQKNARTSLVEFYVWYIYFGGGFDETPLATLILSLRFEQKKIENSQVCITSPFFMMIDRSRQQTTTKQPLRPHFEPSQLLWKECQQEVSA